MSLVLSFIVETTITHSKQDMGDRCKIAYNIQTSQVPNLLVWFAFHGIFSTTFQIEIARFITSDYTISSRKQSRVL